MKKIGIIGLPNAGKSTLFKALTQQEIDIASYPFTTIEPNKAIVSVTDERLDKLEKIINPDKKTEATIEFIDVAGLVKDAHKGEGLGNQFLSHIQEVDLILHVVRAFKNKNVTHPYENINPERDADVINLELTLKDSSTVESHIEKTEKEARSSDKKAKEKLQKLEKFKKLLEEERLLESHLDSEEMKLAKRLNLLTTKPMVYLINGRDKAVEGISLKPKIQMNIKEELDLEELPAEERKAFMNELSYQPALDQVVKACYNELSLVTFYTIKGGNKLKAWSAPEKTKAPRAGGIVHTDFEENFIKAKVIDYKSLIEAGSWKKAKKEGSLKTAGKDYVVKDGDVIEFII